MYRDPFFDDEKWKADTRRIGCMGLVLWGLGLIGTVLLYGGTMVLIVYGVLWALRAFGVI